MAKKKKTAEEQTEANTAEGWKEYDTLPATPLRSAKTMTDRDIRIAVAVLIRSRTTRTGAPLGNVAIASKVAGATLSLVKEVRAEIERNGVLACELDGQAAENEGGGQ